MFLATTIYTLMSLRREEGSTPTKPRETPVAYGACLGDYDRDPKTNPSKPAHCLGSGASFESHFLNSALIPPAMGAIC